MNTLAEQHARDAKASMCLLLEEVRDGTPTVASINLTVTKEGDTYWHVSGRAGDYAQYGHGSGIGTALENYRSKLENPIELRHQAARLLARADAVEGKA